MIIQYGEKAVNANKYTYIRKRTRSSAERNRLQGYPRKHRSQNNVLKIHVVQRRLDDNICLLRLHEREATSHTHVGALVVALRGAILLLLLRSLLADLSANRLACNNWLT